MKPHPHPIARLAFLQSEEAAIVSVLASGLFTNTDASRARHNGLLADLDRIRGAISATMASLDQTAEQRRDYWERRGLLVQQAAGAR